MLPLNVKSEQECCQSSIEKQRQIIIRRGRNAPVSEWVSEPACLLVTDTLLKPETLPRLKL